MSLTALLTEGKPNGHKADKVAAAYERLTAEEREAFRILIHDPMWSGPQIAAALRSMGHDVSSDQVQHYRTKLRTGKVTL